MSLLSEHVFTDLLTHQDVTLVINPEGLPYDGTTGVRHAGCVRLADVSPELDCAFCPDCHFQCRISGAWFMDLLVAAASGESGSAEEAEEPQ